jgi:hypothetical protein
MALIDRYLPTYDVSERHHTLVAAPPAAAYAALRRVDLASTPLVRMLLGLRALPSAITHGMTGVRALWDRGPEPVTIATLETYGFRVLVEAPPSELVLGLEGQFWRLTGNVCTPPEIAFRTEAPAPGFARAVWNFEFLTRGEGTTELITETRVRCADADARRRFLPYWYLIRPASGLIRRAILRAIREGAEGRSDSIRTPCDVSRPSAENP